MNGRDSHRGAAALHWAVISWRREVVMALLAAGADANIKGRDGQTPVLSAAFDNTADMLQLLIDGGGSVNAATIGGQTPLISLVMYSYGDAAARLRVLLAQPELNLDARYIGKTAEEWAVEDGHDALAAAIAAEVGQLSCRSLPSCRQVDSERWLPLLLTCWCVQWLQY